MGRVVITEFMDERAVAQLNAAHHVLYDQVLVDDVPRLLVEAAGADAFIVRNRTQVRGALLAALVRCRVVGRLGVGLDNIDVTGCEARGVKVIPASGANALSVAEYVIASAMLLLRGAYRSTDAVLAGQWPRNALSSGREVGSKTLGLVGFGAIGQLAAKLAQGVGMHVIAFDAARIAAMKPGAVLINSARGGVVDEAALAAALKRGHLGGAALDVFDTEPVPAASVFVGCPNLLLTPHIAGVSAESNERVSSMIAQKVLEELA